MTTDYNLYPAGATFTWANASRDLTYMQGTASQETHGIEGDPLYVDSSTGNFAIQSGSPAKNVSVEGPVGGTAYDAFEALFGLSIELDFATAPRPFGAWDVGPYEFGASDTTPPLALAATVATNGTTVTFTMDERCAAAGVVPVMTMDGGAVTLTYSSGSGTTSLVYTTSRTITQYEAGSAAYTQPGNGIEDVSGNDLASFVIELITNNSAQVLPGSMTFSGVGALTFSGSGSTTIQ